MIDYFRIKKLPDYKCKYGVFVCCESPKSEKLIKAFPSRREAKEFIKDIKGER